MTCHNLIVRKRASVSCEYHSSSEESVESEESQEEPEIQAEKPMSCSEASAQSGSDDSSDEEKILHITKCMNRIVIVRVTISSMILTMMIALL